MMPESDREEIAEKAANSIRTQVMSQINFSEKLSA